MRLRRIIKRSGSSMYYSLKKSGLVNLDKKTGFRILLYHSINKVDADDHLGIRVSPEDFFEQMKLLYQEGYKVYRLEELIGAIKEKRPIPIKSIAITFDDGYKDVLENALPVLRRFNFTATIFITLDYIDGKLDGSQDFWKKWNYLSWKDIEQLSDFDIAIGSHSISHPPLSNMTLETMQMEVVDSKQRIEEKSKKTIKLFSYPHGYVNQKLKDVLRKAGYTAACSSLIGKNDFSTDIFELKRLEINTYDDIFEFKKKIEGCYDWWAYFKKGRR